MQEGRIFLRGQGSASGLVEGSGFSHCCVPGTMSSAQGCCTLAGLSWEAAGEFCTTALTLSQVRLQRAFLWSFPSKLLTFSDYLSLLLQLQIFQKGRSSSGVGGTRDAQRCCNRYIHRESGSECFSSLQTQEGTHQWLQNFYNTKFSHMQLLTCNHS